MGPHTATAGKMIAERRVCQGKEENYVITNHKRFHNVG